MYHTKRDHDPETVTFAKTIPLYIAELLYILGMSYTSNKYIFLKIVLRLFNVQVYIFKNRPNVQDIVNYSQVYLQQHTVL